MRPGPNTTTLTRENLPGLAVSAVIITLLLVGGMSLLEMAGAGFEPVGSPTVPTRRELKHFAATAVLATIVVLVGAEVTRR